MPKRHETEAARVLGGERVELGRAFRGPSWLAPHVWLDQSGGVLYWRFRDERGKPQTKARPASEARGALDAFLKLSEAEDAALLKFAKNFGVLGLCAHGRAFTHPDTVSVEARCDPLRLVRPCVPTRCEPLSRWRELAREASDIVGGVADLLRRVPLSEVPVSNREGEAIDRRVRWGHLVRRAQGWLTDSAVSWRLFGLVSSGTLEESLVTDARKLQLGAYCPMLFDVLALQLAQAVTRGEGLYRCAACSTPFFRAWRAGGHRVFCKDCGRRGAMRLFMRDKRAKQNSQPEKEK